MEGDKLIEEIGVIKYINEIHAKQKGRDQEKFNMKQEDMTYEFEISNDEISNIKIKLLINNVYGRINKDDELLVDGINFIVLIKK